MPRIAVLSIPLAALALLLGALSCGGPKPEIVPADRYQLQGDVIRVDSTHRLALLRHDDITNAEGKVWMRGMTMEFPVKQKADLEKLGPGLRVKATLYHSPGDLEYWLADIEIMPKP
jgi:Cu/Ag efflux protein CusF